MIVLQLVVLIIILYVLLCLGVIVFAIFIKFDELVKGVHKLYRPTQDEKINQMTTAEAQKVAIRTEAIILKWIKVASIEIAKNIAKVFGDK